MSSPELPSPGWETEGLFNDASMADLYAAERNERRDVFENLRQAIEAVEQMGQDNPSRCSYHKQYLDGGSVTRHMFFGKHIERGAGMVSRLIVNDHSIGMDLLGYLEMQEFVVWEDRNLIVKMTHSLVTTDDGRFWEEISDTRVPVLHTLKDGTLGIWSGANYKVPVPDPYEQTHELEYMRVMDRRKYAEEMSNILGALNPETTLQDIQIHYNLDNSWR